MVTLESIKEKFERLTDAQKEILSDVSTYVQSDDLSKYIERVKLYDGDNADNDAVISYLEYAKEYTFPDVYYLIHYEEDYDACEISLDDFYCVPLLKYIDNEFAVQLLNRNFIDYVIDPVKNDALDVDQYNDQFFKDEAESFIKEHNEKVRRMKMIKVYDIVWDKADKVGCTNGNYMPATLVLSDGSRMHIEVCRCGCGCSGTARIHHYDNEHGRYVRIKELEFKDKDQLESYLYDND